MCVTNCVALEGEGNTLILSQYSLSTLNLTLFNEHMRLSFSSKGLGLYSVTRSVVKGRVLTHESVLDPKRNMV